jgi:hypothetical protein
LFLATRNLILQGRVAGLRRGTGDMRDAAPGKDFDAIYIDRLRAAYGKIFPAIGTVRATTRNDTVRKFAQQETNSSSPT